MGPVQEEDGEEPGEGSHDAPVSRARRRRLPGAWRGRRARRGHSSSPVRLLIGWGLAWLAVEGIAHVVNGPDSFSDLDALYDAGGLVGAAVGTPLQALLSPVGAVVVAVGVAIGGALLVT